ncbi:MAG: protease complex subunit PrcB family protein [Phycisphaeraceae bacterium]
MSSFPLRFFAVLPLAALCLVLPLAGCASPSQSGTDGEDAGPRVIEPVEIEQTMRADASTFQEPGAFLFKREAEFEAYRRGPLMELDVNWSDSDVVVVALGAQPTGGYWVHVTAAQRAGSRLYVQAIASRPAAEDVVTQAITYPVSVAVVEKTPAGSVTPEVESVTGEEPPEMME